MNIRNRSLLSVVCLLTACSSTPPPIQDSIYTMLEKRRVEVVRKANQVNPEIERISSEFQREQEREARERDRLVRPLVEEGLRDLALAYRQEETLTAASLPSDVLECRVQRDALGTDLLNRRTVMNDCLVARKLRAQGH